MSCELCVKYALLVAQSPQLTTPVRIVTLATERLGAPTRRA